MEEIAAVRLSPLHAVVFACIFQDRKKAGPAMLEFLNAILVEVGEEPIAEIIDMKSEYSLLGGKRRTEIRTAGCQSQR